jgi:hypothetical protein
MWEMTAASFAGGMHEGKPEAAWIGDLQGIVLKRGVLLPIGLALCSPVRPLEVRSSRLRGSVFKQSFCHDL